MREINSQKWLLLMHMSRETIDGNKILLGKIETSSSVVGIEQIRAKAVQWLLNVSSILQDFFFIAFVLYLFPFYFLMCFQ